MPAIPKALPRGIAPDLLHSQVKNTMPYVFEEKASAWAEFPPAKILRGYHGQPTEDLSHLEYFQLCLSSHYLSCGTPVPTDVDNQIRQKLWPAKLPLETALAMADFVIQTRAWDFTRVTARAASGARGSHWADIALSGHLGEWFTVAAGAYCALKQYGSGAPIVLDPRAAVKREELLAHISDEVDRHSEVFGSLMRAHDGLGSLKASASIAHNFGDLDRVMDMWTLGIEDPLRLRFYKLASTPYDPDRKLRYLGRLWVAGELYKSEIQGSSLALENHRHFALRKPRSLRQSVEYLVPTGPFFDDWGRALARGMHPEGGVHPEGGKDGGKVSEATREMVEVLRDGWERQPKTLAYGRGLHGILEVHPELRHEGFGPDQLTQDPVRRQVLEQPQDRFEKKWAEEALKLMDDIPSRA